MVIEFDISMETLSVRPRLYPLLHGLYSGLLLDPSYHSPLSDISSAPHELCSSPFPRRVSYSPQPDTYGRPRGPYSARHPCPAWGIPPSCTSRALSAYSYRLTCYQLGRHTMWSMNLSQTTSNALWVRRCTLTRRDLPTEREDDHFASWFGRALRCMEP